VGDTGWADVAGARAAGVRPVHLDPHGFCPLPDDHDHVVDLDGVTALVAG
jgi:putative hydrolase of the HAD superfamily